MDGDGRVGLVADGPDYADHGGPVKGQHVGEHAIADDPEGKDVGAVVHILHPAFALLRGHVGGRAQDSHVARDRVAAVSDLGDAKIEHLHPEAPTRRAAEEDVARLQIPVHHVLVVHRLQRAPNLLHDLNDLRGAELCFLLQALGQVFPAQVLHHDARLSLVGLIKIGHVHDVGVADLGGDLRLLPEPCVERLVVHHARVQHLHREALLAQPHMHSLIHRAHSTDADSANDFVGVMEDLPDERI